MSIVSVDESTGVFAAAGHLDGESSAIDPGMDRESSPIDPGLDQVLSPNDRELPAIDPGLDRELSAIDPRFDRRNHDDGDREDGQVSTHGS